MKRFHGYVYALSIAVYCSSWTFFGAVGRSASNPWDYLPIYLGPALTFIVAWPMLQKLVLTGRKQHVTTVADFIGSRYGRSRLLAAVVTFIAVVGSLPYISLQLQAISMAWEYIAQVDHVKATELIPLDGSFVIAMTLAAFTVLFGTRQLDVRERHRGIMAAVAVESVIKFSAFAIIALLSVYVLLNSNQISLTANVDRWRYNFISADFITVTVLSGFAIFCLPRQFHVAVVEYQGDSDTKTSRWLFPLYVLLFAVLIVPVSQLGFSAFSPNPSIPADAYVLSIPMLFGNDWLVVLAFIGGISAATGMVIVATIALSIMLSNELLLPLKHKLHPAAVFQPHQLSADIRSIRRFCIIFILIMAWVFNHVLSKHYALSEIGLMSFTALAQLSPAIVGGLYWRRGHRNGVLIGLLLGFTVWFYHMLLPFLTAETVSNFSEGLFGRGYSPLGSMQLTDLTQVVCYSLSLNVSCYIIISMLSRQSAVDQRQAEGFVDHTPVDTPQQDDYELTTLLVADLRNILDPFLSEGRQQRFWQKLENKYQHPLLSLDKAPFFVTRTVQSELAGIIGAASAQETISLLEQKQRWDVGDMAKIVTNVSQQSMFNRDLLEVTVESISQGICVVDKDLNLVAWNHRYKEIFQFPDNILFIGTPIAEVYRVNAARGYLIVKEGDVEAAVDKRLAMLRVGAPIRYERKIPTGETLQVVGRSLADGGYVTTFSDISDYKEVQHDLQLSKQGLEQRVSERTSELQEMVEALAVENKLRSTAEIKLKQAHEDKSKFLIATSHDLLQPINAARLFVAAAKSHFDNADYQRLSEDITNLDLSIHSAEQLISALREISRLDSGKYMVVEEVIAFDSFIAELLPEFVIMAEQKSIGFKVVSSGIFIRSDRTLLRQIIQNIVGNAISYTQRGRVTIGCRRYQDTVSIQVWDTGIGIADHAIDIIFREFQRGDAEGHDQGLGLGLAIVKRAARLLKVNIGVHSTLSKGSCFSVTVPRVLGVDLDDMPLSNAGINRNTNANKTILCVDNEDKILVAMSSLLSSWGYKVITASNTAQAIESLSDQPSIMIFDYHLDHDKTGIEGIEALRRQFKASIPAILATADNSDSVKHRAKKINVDVLTKPIKPAALRNTLRQLLR